MTALALAGAGEGAVQPDLVLPPGFDRIGDVVRFEQDPGPSADRARGVPGSLIAESIPEPAAEGQEPALSGTTDLDEPVTMDEVFAAGEEGYRPQARAWRMTRADLVPCTRCGLRGHVAGDPDRCLYYRGNFGLGGQAAQAIEAAQWQNGKGAR